MVEYVGAPVKFSGTNFELVDEAHASVFVDQASAWWSAYQSQLAPNHLRVVSLYARRDGVSHQRN